MVNYQYTYLIGSIIILILWLILFLYRKDIRKEMWVISLIFGFIALFTEKIYSLDWWRPLTITGTIPGIEDFLFGFAIGGVASVIYEILFNKRIKIKKVKKLREKRRNLNFIFLIFLFVITFGGLIVLDFNSFWASVISSIMYTIVIYIKRPDLIKNSLISGFLVLVASIIGYYILNLITPGFFEEFWLFENIGKNMILGIPLEEHVFYFLLGAFLGPLYEYWKEGKLINIKN
jgi:hypothetical protein|tara:strand:+ start:790 stop:1488 length:699 start_codon:yes stop_codon:yes gene_type:complete